MPELLLKEGRETEKNLSGRRRGDHGKSFSAARVMRREVVNLGGGTCLQLEKVRRGKVEIERKARRYTHVHQETVLFQ